MVLRLQSRDRADIVIEQVLYKDRDPEDLDDERFRNQVFKAVSRELTRGRRVELVFCDQDELPV